MPSMCNISLTNLHFMDNKTLQLLEFFYDHEGIRLIENEVKYQLQTNDDDAMFFLRDNEFIKQSSKNSSITLTRYGRETVETARRNRTLFELQKTNTLIQKRLKLIQYAMAVFAFANIVITILALFK